MELYQQDFKTIKAPYVQKDFQTSLMLGVVYFTWLKYVQNITKISVIVSSFSVYMRFKCLFLSSHSHSPTSNSADLL